MRTITLCMAAVLLSGLHGCESEPTAEVGKTVRVDVHVETEMDSRSAASSEENAVNRMDLYLFDAGTGLLEQVQHPAVEAGSTTMQVTLELADARPKRLLAVANAAEGNVSLPETTPGVTTLVAMMEALTVLAQGAMPASPFVMTGSAEGISPESETVILPLRRRAAKFSVTNQEASGSLTVTKLTFREVPAEAGLFATADGGTSRYADYAPVGVSLVYGTSAVAYLLPQRVAANRAQLVVEGTLGNAAFSQVLPLKPLDATGREVDIEPNSHYTVTLTAPAGKLSVNASLTAADAWTDGGNIVGVIAVGEGSTVAFNGIEWMDRNLGAESADFEQKWAEARGSFFQWGRNTAFVPDGYETVSGPLSADEVAANEGAFITKMSGDWISPSDDTLWDEAGKQPCPEGYRLPTAQEWFGIIPSSGVLFNMYNGPKIVAGETLPSGSATAHYWGDNTGKVLYGIKRQGEADAYLLKWEYLKTTDGNAYTRISRWPATAATTFASKSLADVRSEFEALGTAGQTLTLPASGYITGSNGAYSDNKGGYYWASSPNAAGAWRVEITDGKIIMTTPYNSRVSGHSLRCIAE